jgi:hypothetical protein
MLQHRSRRATYEQSHRRAPRSSKYHPIRVNVLNQGFENISNVSKLHNRLIRLGKVTIEHTTKHLASNIARIAIKHFDRRYPSFPLRLRSERSSCERSFFNASVKQSSGCSAGSFSSCQILAGQSEQEWARCCSNSTAKKTRESAVRK